MHACYSSLFTDRAISYRARLGYDQLKVALSVGVMPMVRSDLASSGVIFTLDTESGFRDVVTVTGAYGLGEFVVQGVVTPDEWTGLQADARNRPSAPSSVGGSARRRCGSCTPTAARRRAAKPTPADERARFCLDDDDVLTLARWSLRDRGALLGARRTRPADGHRVGQGRRHWRLVHRAGAAGDRALRRSLERRRPRCTG